MSHTMTRHTVCLLAVAVTLAVAAAVAVVVPASSPADVASKRTSEMSLMPEGLERGLSRGQFADLIAYLTALKPPESTAAAQHGQPAEIPPLRTPVTLRRVNADANRFRHPVWLGAVP